MRLSILSFVRVLFLSLAALVLVLSCSRSTPEDPIETPEYFTADYSMNNLPVSDFYKPAQIMGPLGYLQIEEASGLAVSRQNPDYLWTHNDSGDFNRIFLLHKSGQWRGTFRIINTANRDWEDMAIGPGPQAGVNYLYVADIGDNNAVYDVKHIYRFPEPDLARADTNVQMVDFEGAERISFTYPDQLMDAETLLMDPWTKHIYIVTKRELPLTVYKLPYPQNTTDTVLAVKYGTLPFTRATGGDISADGKQIVIKTKEEVFLWLREEGESMKDAWLRQPLRLNYTVELQGEAIAFTPDSRGYYTLSEMIHNIIPNLYFYEKR